MYVYALRVYIYTIMPQQLPITSDDYAPLRNVLEQHKKMRSLNAFNMFLSWVKVFRYLSFIP